MDASDKLAKPPVSDNKYRWLTTGYLPIALAATGCAAVIAIAFEAKDLSSVGSVLDRSRPAREKIMVDSSLMHHALIDLNRDLESIEINERNHHQRFSVAQNELDRVQRDKADATQQADKVVKAEAQLDFDRAAEKRIEAVRDQLEDAPKSLAILKDKFIRGQIRLASLIDQRAKTKLALPQTNIDETRLREAATRLEDEIRSGTKRRDAAASDINRAQGQLHQLQHARIGQTMGLGGPKRLADDLRKQSELNRKDVAELERNRAMLTLQTKISAAVPRADQSNQEERTETELKSREAELKSQDAELDARRIELEQNIKVLQQQNADLVKANKSFQDQLDAADASLASVMEQIKTLEPDRRAAVALQAQLEELNRQIDERRKMIDRPARPAPRSRLAHPVPLGATDQPPRGVR